MSSRPRQNIDDILVGVTPNEPETHEDKQIEAPKISESQEKDNEETGHIEKHKEPGSQGTESYGIEEPSDKLESKEAQSKNLDEYGNEVGKPRMYSEEDVQRMIRDRLSRGQHAQPTQQQSQQIQEAAKDFKSDPNNPEDWEAQLEQFVEKTLDKVTTKQQTKAWQENELQRQNDFQEKFTMGMEKYKDFKEVVGQMPITDAIMMASRDLKDPAAFIYAASKLHPEEVKRISMIADPFSQAREVGRLEESMRKARNVTRAAPPLTQTKGDTASKTEPKRSIDQLILKHAKSKRR